VIEQRAVGFRCVRRDISGPFRWAKSENNGNSNGMRETGTISRPLRPTATGPASSGSSALRAAAPPHNQAAAPAARQTQQRPIRPCAVQPAQQP